MWSRPAPDSDLPPPAEAYARLESALFARSRRGVDLGLDRLRAACAALDLSVDASAGDRLLVHVAGTNGKGSTSAFIASLLRGTGLRTALYTSPHLEHFSERFVIDGQAPSEARLVALADRIRADVPGAFDEGGLTFFELVTLLGFLHFHTEQAQAWVLETGLGGRLDATNVVVPSVCALTPIGLDHQDYLGPTLTHIAGEKAGILKPGVPAVSAPQAPEAWQVIEARARALDVPLSLWGRDFELNPSADGFLYTSVDGALVDGLRIPLRGPHQRVNAGVALRVVELLGGRLPSHSLGRGLESTRWPGRLETISSTPELVLDGAHNAHGVGALLTALPEVFPQQAIHLVFGVLADKDAADMVRLLARAMPHPIASVTCVTPPSPRALPAQDLARLFAAEGVIAPIGSEIEKSISDIERRSRPEDVVLVAGSLYLIGHVRAAYHGRHVHGPSEWSGGRP